MCSTRRNRLHAFFWLETICVVAFGISWLVKGGFLGILADKSPTPAPHRLLDRRSRRI